jgi:hypothetical protein
MIRGPDAGAANGGKVVAEPFSGLLPVPPDEANRLRLLAERPRARVGRGGVRASNSEGNGRASDGVGLDRVKRLVHSVVRLSNAV